MTCHCVYSDSSHYLYSVTYSSCLPPKSTPEEPLLAFLQEVDLMTSDKNKQKTKKGNYDEQTTFKYPWKSLIKNT